MNTPSTWQREVEDKGKEQVWACLFLLLFAVVGYLGMQFWPMSSSTSPSLPLSQRPSQNSATTNHSLPVTPRTQALVTNHPPPLPTKSFVSAPQTTIVSFERVASRQGASASGPSVQASPTTHDTSRTLSKPVYQHKLLVHSEDTAVSLAMGIDAAKPGIMDMTAVRTPHIPTSLAMPPLISGKLQSGETALGILTNAGLSTKQGLSMQRAIQKTYNLQRLRIGHRYTVQLTPTGGLARFTYEVSPDRRLVVLPHQDTFVGDIETIPYHYSERTIAGRVEDSLYVALTSQGESPKLVQDFVDVFSWKLDVAAHTQPGDTFRLLVEDRAREGRPLQYHRILAAEFVNQDTVWHAVYYKDKQGGEYYRPDGTSLRGMFLRSPVRYTRISSHYSRRRLHPILKRYRPHWGIDYAAPSGTPVYSIGDGVVKWVGRKGQNGKMVKIKHNRVYTSYYLHLSRFAKDIKRGVRVEQGQLIGHVGATGLATGPHLDFRLSKRGRYINPLTNDSIEAPPIPRKALPAFRTHATTQLAKLQQASSHQFAKTEDGQKTRP